MKNILILASGVIAKQFIDWVSKNRVAENQYYVTCYKQGTTPDKVGNNITLIDADPSSFSKLERIMTKTKFSNVFIVMEDIEDARYVLKNLESIVSKERIVLVNQWGDDEIGKEQDNITIVHGDRLVAAHLYDQLPNVPLVAQNVGLGQGEIMEVHVPFGSSYAYRHIGSILQRKWKIAAVYREDKQILPTNATMIRPNDTLLIIGKPRVLDGVYRTINKRMGLFPEPFGKNIYLILDFRHDKKHLLRYVQECLYLLEKLENKTLVIRILYPNDFDLIDEIKAFEAPNIKVFVHYKNDEISRLIEYDIHEYGIGMVLNSIPTFESGDISETLFALKKLVYLFGKMEVQSLLNSIVLMSENEVMESISSTAFDISETLGLGLTLANYNPEGEFESKKMVIEHYETLTHIFNMEMKLEEKIANPMRELSKMKNVLQVAPFEKDMNTNRLKKLISDRAEDFILTTNRHPKLLVPFDVSEA